MPGSGTYDSLLSFLTLSPCSSEASLFPIALSIPLLRNKHTFPQKLIFAYDYAYESVLFAVFAHG